MAIVVRTAVQALVACLPLVLAWTVSWAQDGEDRGLREDVNPYLAREGLSPAGLLDYLERMQTKPKSIRERPGFAEAMVDAVDRVLDSDATADQKVDAVLVKCELRHFQACLGNTEADKELAGLAESLAGNKREHVQRIARFYQLEQRVLAADGLPVDQLPALVADVKAFFAAEEELGERHLRLASASVRVVNRLADDEAAGHAYHELGALFAKSDDRILAKYGRQIEKGVKPATLVGKPLELEGQLVDGAPLDWGSYRGKVVLVDFWATWCGPCRAELPNVKRALAEYQDRGFVVLGVSLDSDREALQQFLTDEQIPWANLFSEGDEGGWKHPMAVKYGVQAIPATFLVDRDGKVVAQDLRGEDLHQHLAKLLDSGDTKPAGQ
jgi:thiol-disulfide isomerase/thioredoxin